MRTMQAGYVTNGAMRPRKPLLCPGSCVMCAATGITDLPGCPCVKPTATPDDVRAFEGEAFAQVLGRVTTWTATFDQDSSRQ